MRLIRIARELSKDLSALSFSPPVTHVYNPLDYAWKPHRRYLDRFGRDPREVVLLGMNPGPWGMAQTGVPFGEINLVRSWLGIEEKVNKPEPEHPKRPIQGFECKRSEVSGARLWGWARDHFDTPEAFFSRFFIANYCPLSFMEEGGKNRTPDKLPAGERDPLLERCDRALRQTVRHFGAKHVIGVGAFAENRAKIALEGLDLRISRVLHPSPASPLANKDWPGQMTRAMQELGVL
jgi:single-strand selective monofunctional uracil DNA glycosylase